MTVTLNDVPAEMALDLLAEDALATLARLTGLALDRQQAFRSFRHAASRSRQVETRVLRLRHLTPRTVRVGAASRLVVPLPDWLGGRDLLGEIARRLTPGTDGRPLGGVDFDLVTGSLILSDTVAVLDQLEGWLLAVDAAAETSGIDALAAQLEEALRKQREELRRAYKDNVRRSPPAPAPEPAPKPR